MERVGDWSVALVKGITNADPLLTAVERGELPCSVVRGELIASRLHIATAVHRLVLNPNLAKRADQLAPNAHLLVSLSLKSGAALKTFAFTGAAAEGAGDESPGRIALLALKSPTPQQVVRAIQLSGGTVIPLSRSEDLVDRAAVAQIYGISEQALSVGSLSDVVASHLAVTDV
jgi:hypothetical protein